MATRCVRIFILVVVITVSARSAIAQALPASWNSGDIGAVGAGGSAKLTAATFTVAGAGADIWGYSDAFRFLYLPLSGDGEVVARVAALDPLDAWTKAGVMLRDTLAADSAHALMLVSPAKGLAFQRRLAAGGASLHTSGGSGTAPAWLRMRRTGSTFTAAYSADGVNWTTVGSETIAMGTTIYAGVAVSSHVPGVLASAAFDCLQVTPAGAATMPAGWATADLGAVGTPGAAAGGTKGFTLDGAGADIWGNADAFRFAYTPLSGDGSVTAQVTSSTAVDAWTKAGVMMRDGLSAGAAHAAMVVTPGRGLAFQRRQAAGGSSAHTSGPSGTAPYFVRLTRAGSTVSGYASLDGTNWSLVGSDTIPMGQTIYVGLVVSSHVTSTLARATFGPPAITTSTAAPPVASAPPPPPPSTTAAGVRVLHWNTHHGGIRTDGVYDPALIASWIAHINPDIVSLNEVDTTTHVTNIVSALQAKTGVAWTTSFSGLGNLLLSKLPVSGTSRCVYPDGVRNAAQLSTIVNGRALNIWSIHETVDSASSRLAETQTLQACALNWPEARILAGDYNMLYGSTEYWQAATGYRDAWLTAKAAGSAINYPGNCDGCTRGGRIDYVFSSGGAGFLALRSVQIFDTRDGNGVMPSDHKPMLVIYDVQ